MKKYKHKILEDITAKFYKKENDGTHTYQIIGLASEYTDFIHQSLIVNSNDWEEIVEKDYLITSFCNKETGAHRPINENGLYGYVEPFKHLDIMLKEGHEIFTVKNKSGIEFKVGDKVRYISKATTNPFTINNFFISDKGLLARSSDDRYATCEFINEIEKIKEPIFISADGHEYFDINHLGDVFSVYPKESWTEKRCSVRQALEFNNWLHFHTKEARQEYIDNNKPKYSMNDILNSFEKHSDSPIGDFLDNIKSLNR